MFDLIKARDTAEAFAHDLEDEEFWVVVEAIRQACNEIDRLRAENAALRRVYGAAKACNAYLTTPFLTQIESGSTMHTFLSNALAAVPKRGGEGTE